MVDGSKLVKRIQEMRDEGYLSDAILREAVKQLKTSDDRYNFVGATWTSHLTDTSNTSNFGNALPIVSNFTDVRGLTGAVIGGMAVLYGTRATAAIGAASSYSTSIVTFTDDGFSSQWLPLA